MAGSELTENINSTQEYKMITLRGDVLFPGQTVNFDLARGKTLSAVNKALADNSDIFVVSQKSDSIVNPAPKDINKVGTLAKIKQVIKLPDDTLRVLLHGEKRMQIESFTAINPFFTVLLSPFESVPIEAIAKIAIANQINSLLEKFKKFDKKIPNDSLVFMNGNDIESIVSIVGTYIVKNYIEKQKLLEMADQMSQLEFVYGRLITESEIAEMEKKINLKVRANIDKNQKEYYLREQVKVLHEELGDDVSEIEEYKKRMSAKNLPQSVTEKVNKELIRLSKMSPTSPESGVSRTYLDLIMDLPWEQLSEDNNDLKKAREILDDDHYGLDKVKERIVEFLAVHQLTKSLRAPILCFVGPPGVGKTSIVQSIARALDRKLVTMSLGGVRDEAEIRGHRRTYIGALPGRIISGIKQSGVNNPVFLLDEIDKMSSDFRGDPASALLEVLDPNQNNHFNDHYLEIDYDLSNVMFVATANTLDTIPSPLLDRMEVIELSGYTYEEKLQIAKRYLVPKQIEANGLKKENFSFLDETLFSIISLYTRESGVRNLDREIATVARKVAVKVLSDKENVQIPIKPENIKDYLGAPKHIDTAKNLDSEVGLAVGLAWTSVGGVTMNIEVVLIPNGKGDIILTGSLGDVMKESCQTALSLVKSMSNVYKIPMEKFSKCDLHIHFPEGATPKDGPSAGITISTAILSVMTEKKVDKNVAMTGEVTLRGRVLAIGGLKEKSLAAYRSGIKKLIIPLENKKDEADIPKEVQDNLEIVYADNIKTVFDNALV